MSRRFTSKGFDCVTDVTKQIDEVRKINDALVAIDLPNEQTTKTIGEQIRDALSGMSLFQDLISQTQQLERACHHATNEVQSSSYSPIRWRNTAHGFGNSCDSIKRLQPSMEFKLPDTELIHALYKPLQAASAELKRCNAIWEAWKPIIEKRFSNNDWYKDKKKQLTYGCRDALSILRCWAIGTITNTYSGQDHKMFGMQFRFDREKSKGHKQTIRKLRIGNARSIHEHKGRAPSHANGIRLLTEKFYRDRSLNTEARFQRIRFNSSSRFVTMIGGQKALQQIAGVRHWQHVQTSNDNSNVVRRWITARITPDRFSCYPMVSGNGKPLQLNETDYAIPCIWTESEYRIRSIRGYIIVRVGYANCYHVSETEFNQWMTDDTIASYGIEGFQLIGDRIRLLMNDRTRPRYSGYGNQKSAEERKREARKNIADMVKKLRALQDVVFTPEDSYAVRNCKPGTKQFMEELGIQENAIDAKTLLTKWRRVSYVQRDLFGRVIDSIFERELKRSKSAELMTT